MDNQEELKIEKKSLRHDFSAEEILDLSRELAHKNDEFNSVDSERKATASSYGAKLKTLGHEMDELATKVNDGHEFRDIECDVLFHTPTAGRKTFRRRDNGVHLPSEPMEAYENDLFNQPTGKQGEPDEAEYEEVEGNDLADRTPAGHRKNGVLANRSLPAPPVDDAKGKRGKGKK